jgi:hypothetical protein
MRMNAAQVEALEVSNAHLSNAGLPTINQMLGKQADAVQSALHKVVQIKVKSVYGVIQAYPANEAAELFAQIAGTKTLKHETLALAERLGFAIEEVKEVQFYRSGN